MLLSPEIEKAALSGKCIWRTFNTGMTDSYTIPVPAGSYIILKQIIAYPYLQPQKEVDPPNSQFIYQLVIAEEGSNNELVYVIRNNYKDIANVFGQRSHLTPGEPQQIETWGIFKKDVIIDIGQAIAINAAVFGPQVNINNNANERRGGLGYGNVPITPTVNLDGLTTFYPSGQKRQFSDVGIPYAGNVQDRLRYKFDTVNTITPPAGIEEIAAFEVPLITFGYWEFKGAYKDAF